MGQFEVDLNECLDGKVKRLWRSLAPRTEKDEVSGDVELVLQWRYNARLDFCPFDGFVDEHEGEAPNELRIALIRAQGLAIACVETPRHRADAATETTSRQWRRAPEI